MTIRKRIVHGLTRYTVDWTDAEGVRHRPHFPTKKAAEDEMDRLKKDHRKNGELWSTLSHRDREAVMRAYESARRRGIDLRSALETASEPSALPPVRVPLREAISATIAAKKEANRRPRYIHGLEKVLLAFARGREEMFIDEVTPQMIREWFAYRKLAPSSRASDLGRISAMFTVSIREGWMEEGKNPCDRIERPSVEHKPAVILTHRQTCKVLAWGKRRGVPVLAWTVLALLAGIRPEEAEKITWGDVDLEEKVVRVPAAAGKVRQRRIVHLSWQAWVWLTLAKDLGSSLPISHVTRRRYIRRMRLWLKWERWPQDVLRKTYASNTLANWQDAGRLADEMGTSVRMIFTNYRELVRKADAARWVEIVPRLWCRWPRKPQSPESGSRKR